jgi:hypothetical protein
LSKTVKVLGLSDSPTDTTSSLSGKSTKNVTSVDEKPVNDQSGSPGPKKDTEPKVPEHGQELKDTPTAPVTPKPDKE